MFRLNVSWFTAGVEDGLLMTVGAGVEVLGKAEYSSTQEDDDTRMLLGLCSATGCTVISVHGSYGGRLGVRSYAISINTCLTYYDKEPEVVSARLGVRLTADVVSFAHFVAYMVTQ